MQWFRWYHGSCADPKFGRVARRAGQTRERVVFVWMMILESASDAERRGYFSVEADDIADTLNCDTAAVEAIIAGFSDAGMIAVGSVTAWEKRQPSRDSSANRMRQKRERDALVTRRDDNSDALVTPPDTDTDTDTEKKDRSIDHFENFWNAFPRKIGKGQARKAFAAALAKTEAEALIAGAKRYAASREGQDAKFTVHPATWLNGERWLDEGMPLGAEISPADERKRIEAGDAHQKSILRTLRQNRRKREKRLGMPIAPCEHELKLAEQFPEIAE